MTKEEILIHIEDKLSNCQGEATFKAMSKRHDNHEVMELFAQARILKELLEEFEVMNND